MIGYELNVTGQTLYVFAFDNTTGKGKAGEAANITIFYQEKGGASTDLAQTITEVDATNMPGVYSAPIPQGIIDTQYTFFHPKCSTANVGMTPAPPAFLVPAGFSTNPMRGTDSAFLAANAPTNFADLAVTATTGQVTVGTNNDKTGYTASTVSDKTGYSISGTKTTLDALNDFDPATQTVDLSAATQAQIDAILAAVPQLGVFGSVSDVAPTTSGFDINAALGANGDRDGQLIIFLPGSANPGHWRTITTHTATPTPHLAFSSTKRYDAAWPNTPVNGDPFLIGGVGEILT